MKKKVISVVLSAVLLLTAVPVTAITAGAQGCDCENTPIVYISGKTTIFENGENNGQGDVIDVPDGYIEEQVKLVLPEFAKAVVTNNYDRYCDMLFEAIAPVFERYRLSDEGTVVNGTGPNNGLLWNHQPLPDYHRENNIQSYRYYYDARTDPWLVADDINAYIQAVKTATGHDKVSIICRCIGTDFVMAYLVKYGTPNNYSDIESCMFYNGTLGGVALVGELYSGRLKFESSSLSRYANEWLGTDILNDFLKQTIALADANLSLHLGTAVINGLCEKIGGNVLPRVMKASYATLPGYWSMVGDEYYEDAKTLLFDGEQDKYAGLIEKIDNVHYNVQVKTPEILKSMHDEYGINIGFTCKYGSQAVPVTESSVLIGDDMIELSTQSLGATCAFIGETLSADYIESVENKSYISLDNQVDASTALFPDSTWIIKGLKHDDFPFAVDALFWKFFRFDGQMTVNDFEEFPQYFITDYVSEDEDYALIYPMTPENTQPPQKDNIFVIFFRFIRSLFALIKSFFATGSIG